MNIYIRSYIYFIYNTRPAINNFRISALLLTYVTLLQNLSANAVLLDIYQPIETWLDVSLIISLLWNVSVLMLIFFRSIIATYSRQLYIECIKIPSVKVCGKIRCLLPWTNFIQKLIKNTSFFRLLLRSTAAAVKSGCLSNVQVFIMVR